MKNVVLLMSAFIIIALTASCSGKSRREAVLFVSPAGNDTWSGMLAEPNRDGTDGPFATLERARDAIRVIKRGEGLPAKGATVNIRGGVYQVESTLALTAEDSGAEGIPFTWRAFPGETARILGGRYINSFHDVSDPASLIRLDDRARNNVKVADLSESGIGDFGLIDPASGRRIELYFKGKFMTVARYPDDGWLLIENVPQTGPSMINRGLDRDTSAVPRGRHYGRFTYPGDRPDRWNGVSNLWVHGYWTWDWSDQYLRVADIDTAKREITPEEPHHNYGYTKGQRFYFLNVLEELDSPGEWYLDIDNGMLYFWPPSPIGENDALVSVFEGNMVTIENAENITLRGLLFEGGRGGAIHVNGGENVTVAGCAFRNFGQTAVTFEGGTNNGITSSDLYDLAGGGIVIDAGDRATLEPAGNYAVNCHIHNFGVRLKTYRPAIQITGVGNRAAHNLIHDAPHTGIFLVTSKMGNDHVIEYNELHSLAKETGDVGAIYLCARDYSMRGNVIRYNYLHDLSGPGMHGVMAIYLDDFTSGTEVYGNICVRASRAILLGGGRDNLIGNNIFVGCDPSVHVDARGIGWAKYYFGDGSRFLELLDAVDYGNPPYSERYPELLTLMDDNPAMAKNNQVVNNISTGGRWLDLYDGLDFDIVDVTGNHVSDPVLMRWNRPGASGFTTHDMNDVEVKGILEREGNTVSGQSPVGEETSWKDFAPPLGMDFEPIPTEKIGLFSDEYRLEIPRP